VSAEVQQLSRGGSCAGDFCAGAEEVLQRDSADMVHSAAEHQQVHNRCRGAEVLSRCRGSAEVVVEVQRKRFTGAE